MRWRLGIAALASGATIAGLLPYPLAKPPGARTLTTSLERATGLAASVAPGATLRLLPWPRVRFRHLRLQRDGHDVLDADAIEVPLFARWGTLSRHAGLQARLIRPRFALDLDSLIPAQGPASPQDTPDPIPALANKPLHILLQHARITLTGQHLLHPLELRDVNAAYESRGMGGPVALRFSGSMEDRPLLGRLWLGHANAQGQPVALGITGPLARFTLNGLWQARGAAFYGSVDFASQSPRWIAPFHGPILDLLRRARQLTIHSSLKLLPGEIDAPQIRGEIDGQSFVGLLALDRRGPKPSLSGTLAAQHVRLRGAAFAASSPQPGATAPSILQTAQAFNLDLRASIARLSWRSLTASKVAVALNSRGGPLRVDIAQADVAGGTLRATMTLGSATGTALLQGALHLRHIPVSEFCTLIACPTPFSGLLSLDATLGRMANLPGPLAASLSGPGTFTITDGVLPGPDLGRWLRGQARNPGALLSLADSEGTVFTSLSGKLAFSAGAPANLAFTLVSPALAATAGGTLDPATLRLNLRASARQTLALPATAEAPAELNFKISGPLLRPRLTLVGKGAP